MSVTVVITGDKKLNRALKKLPSAEQKKVFKAAARPAVKPVMQQARQNAQRDKKTGTLAKSIKVRAIPRSRVRIGIRVTTSSESFTGNYYASFQEYGWKSGKGNTKIAFFGWKFGKGNTKIAGRNHMKDAASVKGPAALKDYSQRMKKAIQDTFKK